MDKIEINLGEGFKLVDEDTIKEFAKLISPYIVNEKEKEDK